MLLFIKVDPEGKCGLLVFEAVPAAELDNEKGGDSSIELPPFFDSSLLFSTSSVLLSSS